MLQRLLRTPRGVEVGVAIPIGCMVQLAIAAAALVGAGVFLGTPHVLSGPDHAVVRVIDDGAVGGPRVLSGAVRLAFFRTSPGFADGFARLVEIVGLWHDDYTGAELWMNVRCPRTPGGEDDPCCHLAQIEDLFAFLEIEFCSN